MATEIERSYNEAKKALDVLISIKPESGIYTVKGKKLNIAEYRSTVDEARTKVNELEQRLKTDEGSRQKTKDTLNALLAKRKEKEDLINLYTDSIANSRPLSGPETGATQYQKDWTPKEIAEANDVIRRTNIEIAELNKQIVKFSPTTVADLGAGAAEFKGAGPVVPAGEQKKQGGGKQKVVDGTGGGGTGSSGKGKTGGKTPAPPVNWEAKFREMFPAQSWLLDIDSTKFPTLRKVLQDAITFKMYESAEGQDRFAAQLDGTDFYTNLRNNKTITTINTTIGDLGFDTANFNKFVTTAANMGWSGDTLKQEVYKEAFRKNDDGTYANVTARQRVLVSNDYKKVESIARAYFNPISEDMVAKTLTGQMSTDDVERQQRELAKTKYGHLSNLIDQGFTLDDLTQPYQKIAGGLLEKDPNTIDMTNPDFEAAYNFTDETGNKRLLTSGEWQRMVKSDSKYGWQNTDNAKQSAQRLALSIAQSFGRLQ